MRKLREKLRDGFVNIITTALFMLNACSMSASDLKSNDAYINEACELLARVANSESSTDYKDAAMVMNVIINRSIKQNKSIRSIIYARKQFSGVGNRMFNFNIKSQHGENLKRIALYMLTTKLNICSVDTIQVRNGVDIDFLSDGLNDSDITYFVNPKLCRGSFVSKVIKHTRYKSNNGHIYAAF
jgi:hypothetical protein